MQGVELAAHALECMLFVTAMAIMRPPGLGPAPASVTYFLLVAFFLVVLLILALEVYRTLALVRIGWVALKEWWAERKYGRQRSASLAPAGSGTAGPPSRSASLAAGRTPSGSGAAAGSAAAAAARS